MTSDHLTPLERISILETEWGRTKDDLKEIKDKLDLLLHLKSKGLGAVWLISLLVGSGLIGFLHTIINVFTVKPHP